MGRRPRSSGKPKHVKGEATRLNISALHAFFGEETEKPNRMDATDKPHIRRCFDAGLVELSPDRTRLILTPAGREAIEARYSSL